MILRIHLIAMLHADERSDILDKIAGSEDEISLTKKYRQFGFKGTNLPVVLGQPKGERNYQKVRGENRNII